MKPTILCLFLCAVAAVSSCRTATRVTAAPETPAREREIAWQDAKRLLASAPIKRVFLAHSYGLMFELHGMEYRTEVPDHVESDWVWKTMDRRRQSGDPIEFIVE